MDRAPFDATAVTASPVAQIVSGNDDAPPPARRGRKRKHTSAAAKLAAHRDSHARMDFITSKRIGDTVAALAQQFDCSKNEVLNSLVRFALTNRNFKQVGLWGMGKPGAEEQQS